MHTALQNRDRDVAASRARGVAVADRWSTPASGGTGMDAILDIPDLGQQIEALRAFLARYPAHHPDEAPPQGVTVATPGEPTPTLASSFGKTTEQVLGKSRTTSQAPRPESLASPPLHENAAAPIPLPRVRSAVPVSIPWPRRWRIVVAAAIVVLVAGLALNAIPLLRASATGTGVLTIETRPAGIPVLVDGATRGVTPLEVPLAPGTHALEVGTDRQRRLIPVTITAGGRVSQVLEFSNAASARGELQVQTDPAGVSVIIDGRSAGLSPLTVTDLAAGDHTVELGRGSDAMITEQVLIQDGRTVSLIVPMNGAPRANVAGWIAVEGARDVRVYEHGQLLGDSAIGRIMVTVGQHELEIVNETLGYRELRTVHVSPGQVSPVTLSLPQGSLAINAIPWAEVSVDGQRVGETPLANVRVPIGLHEIAFRHPDLGERRSRVTVKPGESVKVGVDLTTR